MLIYIYIYKYIYIYIYINDFSFNNKYGQIINYYFRFS